MQPDKASTAPVFPADHLAGAKADRAMDTKDGLTAWAAIRRLFPEPKQSGGPPGGYAYYDSEDDEDMWPNWAVADFRGLLKDGSWRAMGFRAPVNPTASLENIQPGLWSFLAIDLKNNSASGGGLEYAGLLFFEANPEAKKTKKAENQCREWLVRVMKAERRKHVSQLMGEADQKISGLSEKAFKRAWKFAKIQPTTHKSWQARGPIPS